MAASASPACLRPATSVLAAGIPAVPAVSPPHIKPSLDFEVYHESNWSSSLARNYLVATLTLLLFILPAAARTPAAASGIPLAPDAIQPSSGALQAPAAVTSRSAPDEVTPPDSMIDAPPAKKPGRRGKTAGGGIRQGPERKTGSGPGVSVAVRKALTDVSTGAARGSEPASGMSAASGDGRRTAWHLKSSPHFEVYHESSWSPSAIGLELERMYSSMRLNMAMFAPWMVREKTKIYIYSGRKSYLAGEFKPPEWSKGLAFFGRKTVVVYDTGDMIKLKAVIVHELTHLYFESYFGEKLSYPPQWLNEGLAVFMEDNSYPEGGPWAQALPYLQKERLIEFDKFFTLKVEELSSERQIGDWYLESYGIVAWLFRPQQRLQFKNFCALMRSGQKADAALWKIYRVKDPIEFEGKWLAWTGSYKQKQNGGFSTPGPSASFNFKPVQFSSFSFTPFGAKK